MATAPIPTTIRLRTESRVLELGYGEATYQLGYEFLRVHSPSAEVQGHGKPVLQTGKRHVMVRKIEPVGRYALKLTFDDGHDSGLYSWEVLWRLCQQQDALWQRYLDDVVAAGASREPNTIGRWRSD